MKKKQKWLHITTFSAYSSNKSFSVCIGLLCALCAPSCSTSVSFASFISINYIIIASVKPINGFSRLSSVARGEMAVDLHWPADQNADYGKALLTLIFALSIRNLTLRPQFYIKPFFVFSRILMQKPFQF